MALSTITSAIFSLDPREISVGSEGTPNFADNSSILAERVDYVVSSTYTFYWSSAGCVSSPV